MELRACIRPSVRLVALLGALGALLITATTADQALAAKRAKAPVVKRVAPMNASIGQTMTITGRYFRRGKGKNSVVFKRDGARAVFVKADIATTKLIKVTLPAKLADFMRVRDGVKQATKFRVRVLATRLGRRYTKLTGSPTIGPEAADPQTPSGSSDAEGDCDGDRQTNGADADDDNDMLADTVEDSYGLDPCKLDTDADGVQDGYEYRSALDLNDDEHQQPNTYLPYPGKRPYPNPLDGTDAGIDFDGDGLTLEEEESLWLYSVSSAGAPRDLNALTYSDGEQYTLSARGTDGRRSPTMSAAAYGAVDGDPAHKHGAFIAWAAAAGYLQVMLQDPAQDWFAPRNSYDIRDFDRDGTVRPDTGGGAYARTESRYFDADNNGWVDDSERDEDADGMTNFQEARNCMVRGYWDTLYNDETPYYRTFAGTKLDDADSDGDGVRDGADDQDNDDLPNMMECSRQAASGRAFDDRVAPGNPVPAPQQGFVNPFNPCAPSTRARACNAHPPVDGGWAPFNPDDKIYYVYN